MTEKNKGSKAFLFMFLFISIISLVFCFAKYGYFIDEIFTLGCANSHYAGFANMLNNGDINNTILKQSDFLKYLAVDNNEIFDFGSVFYNLTYDTQPPLYYLLLNACSSVFQNVFSKWIGLGLNFVLFWIALICLYKTCILLEIERKYSLAAVLMFGLSYSLLSNLLNIRMYILFTCLSLVLTYLFVLYNKTEKKVICILICLTVLSGAMTQYIFLVYAFFLTVAYLVNCFINKKWSKGFLLGASSLIGVLLLVAVFPTVLKVIFGGGLPVSGTGMLDKLKAVNNWPRSLINGARVLVTGTFISFSILITIFLINIRNLNAFFRRMNLKDNIDILLIAFAALFTFGLVSIISPHSYDLNYISNISFVIPLLAAFLLEESNQSDNKELIDMSKILNVAIPVLMAVSTFVVKPNFINGDFRVFDGMISQYLDAPCVYYLTDHNVSPISQDMAQLIQFKNVFVTDGKDYSLTDDYIESQEKTDNVVVYIDTIGKAGFKINEIMNYYLDEMDYSSYRFLYKYGCSECYVFNR